jgi:hypothetical protein
VVHEVRREGRSAPGILLELLSRAILKKIFEERRPMMPYPEPKLPAPDPDPLWPPANPEPEETGPDVFDPGVDLQPAY